MNGKLLSRGIVVSNRAFYVVNIAPTSGSCGVCPPENFCPHDPDIGIAKSYKDLTRLVRGYGNQLCAIGWIKENGLEEFQVAICEGSKDRDLLLNTLHALSAGHAHAELHDRVPMEFDGLFKYVVQDFVNGDWIAAMTYAYREDKGKQKHLGLFALTEMEIFEFSVDFEYWAPNPDDEGADTDDDIGPQVDDMEEMALEEEFARNNPSGSSQPTANRALRLEDTTMYHQYIYSTKESSNRAQMKEIRERREEAKYKGDMERLDTASGGFFGGAGNLTAKEKKQSMINRTKRHIMKVEMQQPLSALTMIAFHPGSQPIMRLDVGGESVMIHFFDDATREVWRRALACALNKSDTSSQWVRDWVNPHSVTK